MASVCVGQDDGRVDVGAVGEMKLGVDADGWAKRFGQSWDLGGDDVADPYFVTSPRSIRRHQQVDGSDAMIVDLPLPSVAGDPAISNGLDRINQFRPAKNVRWNAEVGVTGCA